MTNTDQLLTQIARCKRLARMSDEQTARSLLALAAEYEARLRDGARRECA